MHDTARGEMRYIAADLDSQDWVEVGPTWQGPTGSRP